MSKMIDAIKVTNKKSQLVTLEDGSVVLSHVNDWIPSGCLPLDLIMGGGYPVGRCVEIYGDNSTGKSLLGYHVLAQTQKMGGIAVLFDTEKAMSEAIIEAVGVNRSDMIYGALDTLEEVFETILEVIKAKDECSPDAVMTIVWDSVAATASKTELEKLQKEGVRGASMGIHARIISEMFRALPSMIAHKKILLVPINQTREKIGVMFGDKKTTFGGTAIGFYSSIRLELASQGKLKNKEGNIIGINARAYVAKNKVAPPFGKCDIPIVFGKGMDEPASILEWLKVRELIGSGAWHKLVLKSGELLKFQVSDWEDIYKQHELEIKEIIANDSGFITAESEMGMDGDV